MAPRAPNFALQNADFVLFVGTRLDLVCTAFAPERLARAAHKVTVDVDAAEIAKLGPISTSACAPTRATSYVRCSISLPAAPAVGGRLGGPLRRLEDGVSPHGPRSAGPTKL